MSRKRNTITKEELETEYTSHGTERLDNESFVKAWQSSRTIEDFMEYAIEWEGYCRNRATTLRRAGVNLKYLKARGSNVDDLNRLAHQYCRC